MEVGMLKKRSGKCSNKVKYRFKWEGLGCRGNIRGSGNDDSSNSVQVQ